MPICTTASTSAAASIAGTARYGGFVYVAFTIGVTFAESEADLTSTRMRPAVLPHALLSLMFGAVILGVTVNLVTSSQADDVRHLLRHTTRGWDNGCSRARLRAAAGQARDGGEEPGQPDDGGERGGRGGGTGQHELGHQPPGHECGRQTGADQAGERADHVRRV